MMKDSSLLLVIEKLIYAHRYDHHKNAVEIALDMARAHGWEDPSITETKARAEAFALQEYRRGLCDGFNNGYAKGKSKPELGIGTGCPSGRHFVSAACGKVKLIVWNSREPEPQPPPPVLWVKKATGGWFKACLPNGERPELPCTIPIHLWETWQAVATGWGFELREWQPESATCPKCGGKLEPE